MRSEIEKMLADRLDFLIGVGHDMRAPLTGIAGFAAVLSELDSVAADPTAAEAVAYVRKEAQRLVELLNQLLDFGQVEQGEPRLDVEPIDLVRLARQALEPWAVRRPQIQFRLIHEHDVVAEGDFLKLHRILANLIDNAVRFGPADGAVTIEIGGDDREAEIAVTDEGMGVPVADRERVFGRFVRLDPGGTAHGDPTHERAGIGLYVVRGLVEAHGGTVHIEGGGGARFVVKLPLHQPDTQLALPTHESLSLGAAEGNWPQGGG
ncbi:MAG: sensor histidine kinase [Acidimicrobiia bacterium]